MEINIMDWVNETAAGNMYRGLDGGVHPFPWDEAVVVAQSAHDAFFKLNENWGWGVRWYALHRVAERFVFTVGHGCWHARREVPAEWVPELLLRYFTRNSLTEAGKDLL